MAALAVCPKCRNVMDAYATVYPHCGYDFPLNDPAAQILPKRVRRGLAHGWFGDLILLLGSIFSLLGIVLSLGAAALFLASRSWDNGFRALGLAFSCTLTYVIVQRVTDK